MVEWTTLDSPWGFHVVPIDGVVHNTRYCVCGPVYKFDNCSGPGDVPHLHKTVVHRALDGSPPPALV